MLNIIKMIRWPNLLMVPFTMCLMRYCIVQPMLDYQFSPQLGEQISFQLSDGYFAVLVLINMLLGAAGYIINDYFDRHIDRINRPDEVIVGREVPRRAAMVWHIIFDIAALVLAAVFAWHLRMMSIFLLYAMIAGIFWLYSTTYKKQLLIGNLVVALGTATIPLQVGIFEYLTLTRVYGFEMMLKDLSFIPIMCWTGGFAFFAFIINMIREIVKDMEDLEGDNNYGCNTLPIAYGMKISKIVVWVLSVICIALLLVCYYFFLHEPLTLIYLSIFVIAPIVLVMILTAKADEVKHYHRISTIIKVIMLFGVLYSVLAWQMMKYVV
ncbi:MAG: geranylgeranylglycerol-phosphate geranylgeranyltransferase [Salinivirgaceae bacterium]|nr:geranylgeranylglycerol-phosphate geranylgeranyltransferase [Salinivirgaceae bacterium]